MCLKSSRKITVKIKIQDAYLQLIKKGEKKVEGRINEGKFAALQVGDVVTFKSEHDTARAIITALQQYDSFPSMIESVGLDLLLPHIQSTEEGIQLYRSFSHYAEKEKVYGCLAIYLKVIDV